MKCVSTGNGNICISIDISIDIVIVLAVLLRIVNKVVDREIVNKIKYRTIGGCAWVMKEDGAI